MRESASPRPTMPGLLGQAALLASLIGLYFAGRDLAKSPGQVAQAFDNAHRLWDLQRFANLPSELSVQQWLLDHPTIAQTANAYYAGVHFPFTAAAVVWLYLRRRPVYAWIRAVLVTMTGLGLVLTFAFPLAPPRMMTDLGFTDVAAQFGQSVYGEPGRDAANQFAAMPSLHVGWALAVGIALVAAGATWARWLWLLHPAVTIVVVVGTANHYWADCLVAAALLLLGVAAHAAVGWRPGDRGVATRRLTSARRPTVRRAPVPGPRPPGSPPRCPDWAGPAPAVRGTTSPPGPAG